MRQLQRITEYYIPGRGIVVSVRLQPDEQPPKVGDRVRIGSEVLEVRGVEIQRPPGGPREGSPFVGLLVRRDHPMAR